MPSKPRTHKLVKDLSTCDTDDNLGPFDSQMLVINSSPPLYYRVENIEGDKVLGSDRYEYNSVDLDYLRYYNPSTYDRIHTKCLPKGTCYLFLNSKGRLFGSHY